MSPARLSCRSTLLAPQVRSGPREGCTTCVQAWVGAQVALNQDLRLLQPSLNTIHVNPLPKRHLESHTFNEKVNFGEGRGITYHTHEI